MSDDPAAGPLRFAAMPGRALARVHGPDARGFLQNLVTNDLARLAPDRALYAALLTPQGHYLHDFLVAEEDGAILLECDRDRRDDLLAGLARYRLRTRAEMEALDDREVTCGFGAGAAAAAGLPDAAGAARAAGGGVLLADPRDSRLGVRALLPPGGGPRLLGGAGFAEAGPDDYERLRLGLGIPDGARDLVAGRSYLLESNFDLLDGVSFEKGCYIGQENTARQRWRGTVRRRLVRVRVEGPVPEPGAPVTFDGRDAGTMRSALGASGLALLRLPVAREAAGSGAPLSCGEARLRVAGPVPEPPAAG